MIKEKLCTTCNIIKPYSSFHKDATTELWIRASCKMCRSTEKEQCKTSRRTNCRNCWKDFTFIPNHSNHVKTHCNDECASKSKNRYFRAIFEKDTKKPVLYKDFEK